MTDVNYIALRGKVCNTPEPMKNKASFLHVMLYVSVVESKRNQYGEYEEKETVVPVCFYGAMAEHVLNDIQYDDYVFVKGKIKVEYRGPDEEPRIMIGGTVVNVVDEHALAYSSREGTW